MDLDSLEPDAPAGEQSLNLLPYPISKLVPVLQDIIERHVGDSVPHDRDGHVAQLVVHSLWVPILEILAEHLEALEGTVSAPVHTPDDVSTDFNALHFEGYLLRCEVNFIDQTWEGDGLVEGGDPGLEADAAFDHFTVSHDDEPFVGQALSPLHLGKFKGLLAENPKEEEHNEGGCPL